MKKLAFLFLLIFLSDTAAQVSNEMPEKIRDSIQTRNYPAAVADLKKIQETDKKVFELNNYDYLLARLNEKTGDLAAAMNGYQAVADRGSVLREYALWHLAEIARSTGNLLLERIYLRELETFAPDSLINEAAAGRVARSYLESRDFEAAIAHFRFWADPAGTTGQAVVPQTSPPADVFGDLTGNDAKTRENLVLLGQAYWQDGQPEPARQVFSKLADDLPNPDQPDDFALEGVRGLDKLGVGAENFGKTVPELADTEHLKRAAIYQFNRDFENARLHYQAFLARSPQNPEAPAAMYQIGRGFAQEKNFSKAADWFERVQVEFPESSVAQDALYQAAGAYGRVNKTKEAVSRYEKYIGKYENAANLERAYLNIVDILRDKGEAAGAVSWTVKTREAFRDKLPEAVALFAKARIHLSQKDWNKALVDLESLRFLGNLGTVSTPGGTGKEEVLFLKALVLEQLNRPEEAIDIYLSIPDGRRAYYGWRANQRLQELLKNEATADLVRRKFYPLRIKSGQPITAATAEEIKTAAQAAIRLTDVRQTREQLLETIRKAYSFLPEYKQIPAPKPLAFGRRTVLTEQPSAPTANRHQTLAGELLFLGLYDEGTPELETGNKDAGISPNSDYEYTLAVYYMRGDQASRATAYIEPVWRKIPADYQIELIPRAQLELLYPAPYADPLVRFAPERGVDPRFVLAIMRQESRFRADVKSASAARGLMQFIASTSDQIAIQLGRENFRQDELYHPPTAILFGSQYLSNLFHQFPDQPQAVAAAYNGGEDNMERWFARAASNDPDRYVPEILYAQSKDYVYRVMQNYRIYQLLYDRELKLNGE